MYKPLFMKKKEIQIRHVITPSVSISAAPDFGSSRYGYYDTYIKPNADGTQDTITILHMPDKCSECLDKENLEIFHSRYPITWK